MATSCRTGSCLLPFTGTDKLRALKNQGNCSRGLLKPQSTHHRRPQISVHKCTHIPTPLTSQGFKKGLEGSQSSNMFQSRTQIIQTTTPSCLPLLTATPPIRKLDAPACRGYSKDGRKLSAAAVLVLVWVSLRPGVHDCS